MLVPLFPSQKHNLPLKHDTKVIGYKKLMVGDVLYLPGVSTYYCEIIGDH